MKSKGTLYEQTFFAEALSRNLHVFSPIGDYLPVDCLIMNDAGKVFKVQIKGTENKTQDPQRTGLGRYMITTATGATKKQSIDPSKVDVLAAYVQKVKTWYIIPVLSIDSALRISLYPHNPKSKAKHERFLEDWDYFKR
jgi:hypothetical protein